MEFEFLKRLLDIFTITAEVILHAWQQSGVVSSEVAVCIEQCLLLADLTVAVFVGLVYVQCH